MTEVSYLALCFRNREDNLKHTKYRAYTMHCILGEKSVEMLTNNRSYSYCYVFCRHEALWTAIETRKMKNHSSCLVSFLLQQPCRRAILAARDVDDTCFTRKDGHRGKRYPSNGSSFPRHVPTPCSRRRRTSQSSCCLPS